LVLHIRLYKCADTKNTDDFRKKESILAFHWAVIVLKNQPFSFQISNTAHHFVIILTFVLMWKIRGSSPSRI